MLCDILGEPPDIIQFLAFLSIVLIHCLAFSLSAPSSIDAMYLPIAGPIADPTAYICYIVTFVCFLQSIINF